MGYRMGVDLGGTKVAAGVMDENGAIVGKASVPTGRENGREAVLRSIRRAAELALTESGVRRQALLSIGLGFPGTVDRKARAFTYASNLPDLTGCKMETLFPEFPGERLFIENDANAAALGELIAGAGEGVENFLMLTLGTGVGCGIVQNGVIYTGANGAAGEAGHMVIEKGGRQCGCGRRGCFEQYASASGLIRTTREEMERSRESLMWEICGGDLRRVNGRTAFDGMRRGDGAARRAVSRYIGDLAAGVVNLISLFQPDRIVIGGGLSGEGETLLAPLREIVERERYQTGGGNTSLHIAACRDAGMIGAAYLYTQERVAR